MKLLQTHFDAVIQGEKTVEMRLDDSKRRWIKTGDLIEFSCVDDADRKLVVEVVNKMIFLDFEELVDYYDIKSLGFDGYTAQEVCEYMCSLYSKEKLKACHVVAIEFVQCED